MFEFANEMYFGEKTLANQSIREKSPIRFPKSPAIMISAFGVSSPTRLSSSNPNELCDRLKILLQEKQAGNNSNINNEINFGYSR